MRKIYISSLEKTRKYLYISSLSSFLSKDKKVLIINMENSRDLEIKFGLEDFIIYDHLDYFKGVCDIEQSLQEINENLFLMPSAFKRDKYEMVKEDFENIDKIDGFDYIILNSENINNEIECMDIIVDYIDEDIKREYFYINNRNIETKINSKKFNILQEKGIGVLGDLEIDKDMNPDILNNIWKVYIGEEIFTVDKNLFERIFRK